MKSSLQEVRDQRGPKGGGMKGPLLSGCSQLLTSSLRSSCSPGPAAAAHLLPLARTGPPSLPLQFRLMSWRCGSPDGRATAPQGSALRRGRQCSLDGQRAARAALGAAGSSAPTGTSVRPVQRGKAAPSWGRRAGWWSRPSQGSPDASFPTSRSRTLPGSATTAPRPPCLPASSPARQCPPACPPMLTPTQPAASPSSSASPAPAATWDRLTWVASLARPG